jgi:hypothetical protein
LLRLLYLTVDLDDHCVENGLLVEAALSLCCHRLHDGLQGHNFSSIDHQDGHVLDAEATGGTSALAQASLTDWASYAARYDDSLIP